MRNKVLALVLVVTLGAVSPFSTVQAQEENGTVLQAEEEGISNDTADNGTEQEEENNKTAEESEEQQEESRKDVPSEAAGIEETKTKETETEKIKEESRKKTEEQESESKKDIATEETKIKESETETEEIVREKNSSRTLEKSAETEKTEKGIEVPAVRSSEQTTPDGRFKYTIASEEVNGKIGTYVTITDYLLEEEVVTIPKTIDGIQVGTLKGWWMFNYKGLKQVNLPEGLITIGDYVFANSFITKIVLPSTLKVIELCAFQDSYLASVNIPESIVEIHTKAFYNTELSGSISLGKNLKKIGHSVFSSTNVTAFEVSKDNTYGFFSRNGVLYQERELFKIKNTLMAYPCAKADEAFAVPDDIEEIYQYAFEGTRLKTLVIPATTELDLWAVTSPQSAITLILKHVSLDGERSHDYFNSDSIERLPAGSKVIVKNETIQRRLVSYGEDFVCVIGNIPSQGFKLTNVSSNTLKIDMAKTKEYALSWSQMPFVTTDNIKWTSNKPSVAKVGELTGKITPVSRGEAVITGKDDSGHSARITVNCYNSAEKVSVSKLKINRISSQNYTGKAVKPGIVVKDGSRTLRNGTDYTLTYSNNTNPGTAKVKITGKGQYTGSITKSFSIKVNVKKVTGLKRSSGTTSSVSLKWKKAGSANGYVVYRSTSKSGKKTKLKTITSARTVSYKNTRLSSGKTYYYWIKTYRTVKGKKYYSDYAGLVTAANPSKTTVTVKAGKKKADIKWKKVSGASGYEVYRSTKEKGSYQKVKTITKGSTVKYTNSRLKSKKRYYYKVRAYKNVGKTKVYGSFSTVRNVRVR